MKPADSLKRQLARWLLVPLLVVVSIDAGLDQRSAVKTADESFDRLLVAAAQVIAEDMSIEGGSLKVDLPQAAFALLRSDVRTRVFYRVIDGAGHTEAGQDDLPLPHNFPSSQQLTLYESDYAGAKIHLAALHRHMQDAGAAAPVTVVVGETNEMRQALAHHLLFDGLSRQALSIAAICAMLWYGFSRGLSSLARLREKLVSRPSTDLSAIDSSDVQSEVRPLIDALNVHTDRLSKLLNSREQFIADASHQMRTPLAEMRTQIDYGLMHGDDALVRTTLSDINGELDALSRLIGQMLLLAKSDPDAIDDQRIRGVDLGALAQATALDMVPAARARDVDLRFEHSAGRVFVLGNELLLKELIVNLLDNAIRHGEAGGTVTFRIVGYPGPTMEIEDDGPGIPEDERARVFERFYRGRDALAPGSGLGLAIARNICTAHRAVIGLSTSPAGRGLCARVSFARRYEKDEVE